ncbi:CDP-diacylglycerol--serine O-phosphatidyltransferase [Sporomusa acidovorans]|uniref:CDP-diacylglycerol--serine O-phosphatidyltransferase n=1 Tax=Sporomusa acidovorans (strain ATCC 49682 / DSM 3132 / Mol) TaxID=1123286 RepID=A0ABZ3J3I7_SPOA4|nr:CDP-diacylglycerol--serine O-phosphatidyltransferase [Sporomusa acidovorans]OZC20193.1 CDP-alcohol phosphatidyltransferase [Sporomusa acidovorans DSM 3132]SDD42416.1 CDP-diacylglycerol---serine O-phosphatidyltransferase [Sporomusa acidovorans]
MKNAIPNILTASNLVFGVFAIIFTFQNHFTMAAYFIVAAMIADGLDGRVARYFGVSGDFGKELDSLCDLVSFGVAPAMLAYAFLLKDFGLPGAFIAAAFATCGALRLARFNVNTSKVKGFFMGLPIPAAGCVIATFVMLGMKPSGWFFPLLVAVFAYLMISTIRYPDFKGKDGEPIRLIPVVITVAIGVYILFLTLNAFLFVPFFAYALFGILNTLFGVFDHR